MSLLCGVCEKGQRGAQPPSHGPSEQLRLRKEQRIVATAEDSVLRTEMGDVESQEETRGRILVQADGVAGSLRPQHRDEAWSASLRQTFFSLAVVADSLCCPRHVTTNGLRLMPWVIMLARVPPILGR